MTKKLYIQPEVKVVDINNEQILAGSPDGTVGNSLDWNPEDPQDGEDMN